MRENTERQALLVTGLFCIGIVLAILLMLAGGRLLAARPAPVLGLATLSGESAEAEEGLSTTEVVARVVPSVVSIDLYESTGFAPTGTGSGVILTENGYIATNAHVVYDVPTIRVVLHDGAGYTARLVGSDVYSDLALLKIEASGLAPATLGDSEQVAVGARVVAVGNATGSLPGTASVGIVSGVGRSMSLGTAVGDVVRMNLLQTDAAINPGSSGGALADSRGRVIGICIGKIEDGNVENVGFAIPMAHALPLLEAMMAEAELPPTGMLGVVAEELNETNRTPGLPRQGLVITDITEQSGLHTLAVKPGDVLVRAGEQPLQTLDDLAEALYGWPLDVPLPIEVVDAQSGEVRALEVLLYQMG